MAATVLGTAAAGLAEERPLRGLWRSAVVVDSKLEEGVEQGGEGRWDSLACRRPG